MRVRYSSWSKGVRAGQGSLPRAGSGGVRDPAHAAALDGVAQFGVAASRAGPPAGADTSRAAALRSALRQRVVDGQGLAGASLGGDHALDLPGAGPRAAVGEPAQ